MEQKELVKDYENMQLRSYKDDGNMKAVWFDELSGLKVDGVLKANFYVDGRLRQIYSQQDSHSVVVAATGMGKTTQLVIPTIFSFASQKLKKSIFVSDPKGEVRKWTEGKLKKEGYKVICFDFRDPQNSAYWNPLTPIFRKYQKAMKLEDEVELLQTPDGPRNKFIGKIYTDQKKLDHDIGRMRRIILEDVGTDIDRMALIVAPGTGAADDKMWEDGARDIIKAFLWAMLEDSHPRTAHSQQLITENTYSFATMIKLANSIVCSEEDYMRFDGGYFSMRARKHPDSRACYYAANVLIGPAKNTRASYLSVFDVQINVFKESATKLVTSCNSFDFADLNDGPVAIFVNYRDEVKLNYELISLFVQSLYIHLIGEANKTENGRLERPWYFLLDEFGNFPRMADFDTVISACRGRNIYFSLIIQSYAQLEGVYGKNTADIIKDNLNVHIFMGSNNPQTLAEFSNECGKYTRISPLSALNGNKEVINNYQFETIPLMPISKLSKFDEGECIVTEANSGYVMWSRLERCYKCKEFTPIPVKRAPQTKIDIFDDKYDYTYNIRL